MGWKAEVLGLASVLGLKGSEENCCVFLCDCALQTLWAHCKVI